MKLTSANTRRRSLLQRASSWMVLDTVDWWTDPSADVAIVVGDIACAPAGDGAASLTADEAGSAALRLATVANDDHQQIVVTNCAKKLTFSLPFFGLSVHLSAYLWGNIVTQIVVGKFFAKFFQANIFCRSGILFASNWHLFVLVYTCREVLGFRKDDVSQRQTVKAQSRKIYEDWDSPGKEQWQQ